LSDEPGTTPPKTRGARAVIAEGLQADGVWHPSALPLGPEEAHAETMQSLLSGKGGYAGDMGSYTIDSAENVETLTWLKEELVGRGLTGPVAPGRLDRAKAFAAFADGDVGMLNGHPSLMKTAGEKIGRAHV